jgi:hypothetical protein
METAFNFVVINDKHTFEVNANSMNEAGIKFSSQLSEAAIIVN